MIPADGSHTSTSDAHPHTEGRTHLADNVATPTSNDDGATTPGGPVMVTTLVVVGGLIVWWRRRRRRRLDL